MSVCSGSSGVWLGWGWLVLGPGSLRGRIILPPSKGSAVQASLSPESQLESVEGRQHQFLQGWEDWKEGMFSFGSSVAYHQCSRSCTAPVRVRMDTGRSLEVELELWRGWNVHMYLRGVMAWLSSRVNNCSLPREQHVAGGNVRFVRSVKLCNRSHPVCWAGSGLHGEVVTSKGCLADLLLNCWQYYVIAEMKGDSGEQSVVLCPSVRPLFHSFCFFCCWNSNSEEKKIGLPTW